MQEIGVGSTGHPTVGVAPQSPESPVGLIAQSRWERSVLPSTGALLTAEVVAATAGLGAAALDAPHWAAGTAALVLGGATLVRRQGVSVADWVARKLRRDARRPSDAGYAAFPGGGDIGVRRENGLITAVLRPVASAPRVVSMLATEDPAVPLGVLAQALRHRDTPAARIDVLLAGGRAPSGASRRAAVGPRGRYLDLIGTLPRWAVSEPLIAVSIDPFACRGAVGRRGGDEYRVAALAARRVMDALAAVNVPTTAVGREELQSLTIGAPAGAIHADARTLAGANPMELLGRVSQSGRAAITVQNTDSAGGGVQVSAWVDPGDAPAASRRVGSAAKGSTAALQNVHLPLAGCGQILGADPSGRPISSRLHGRGVRSVWAAVADDPARQLVERAVATGARVLIVTGRPAMWRPLVEWVDDPAALWISGWQFPPSATGLGPGDYGVTVLDGIGSGPTPSAAEPAGTVWRIEPRGNSPVTAADVVLSQPQPGMLTVRTAGSAATVRLVA